MHGIDRIPNQVAENLPYLSFKTHHGSGRAAAHLNRNPGVHETALAHCENSCDQVYAGDELRRGCLFMEAEGLIRDQRHAPQLSFCGPGILSRLPATREDQSVPDRSGSSRIREGC